MTCEYVLADKLKNKYYIRDDAIAYIRASGVNNARPVRKNPGAARTASPSARPESYRRAGTRPSANNSPIRTYAKKEEKNPYMTSDGEIIVKNKLINPIFVACLFVVTIMLLALVMCFSQVYQTANEVGELEMQLETLQAEKDELQVRLDTKNDIKTIETIATTKLGMVKEDSLQRRYVSLSEGEHIDIMENEETTEATGGVMLSTLFSSIGEFFDRFK